MCFDMTKNCIFKFERNALCINALPNARYFRQRFAPFIRHRRRSQDYPYNLYATFIIYKKRSGNITLHFAKQLLDRTFYLFTITYYFNLPLFRKRKFYPVAVVVKHHCQHTAVITQLICRAVYVQVNGSSVECVG